MKRYSKPIIKTEEIVGINEPVYMDCSGSEYFDFSDGSGWTHQRQEDGRWNFAEQINGKYKGPAKTGKLTTYAYVTFDRPVNIDNWEWNNLYGAVEGGDPLNSFTIVGKRNNWTGFNPGEGIGLGALYVVPEDSTYVGNLTITSVKISWNYDGETICT